MALSPSPHELWFYRDEAYRLRFSNAVLFICNWVVKCLLVKLLNRIVGKTFIFTPLRRIAFLMER